jgi:hypothetical protein
MISRTQGTEIKLSDLIVDSNRLSDDRMRLANEQLTGGRRNVLRSDLWLCGERGEGGCYITWSLMGCMYVRTYARMYVCMYV